MQTGFPEMDNKGDFFFVTKCMEKAYSQEPTCTFVLYDECMYGST
jgi:hypothetical protein